MTTYLYTTVVATGHVTINDNDTMIVAPNAGANDLEADNDGARFVNYGTLSTAASSTVWLTHSAGTFINEVGGLATATSTNTSRPGVLISHSDNNVTNAGTILSANHGIVVES